MDYTVQIWTKVTVDEFGHKTYENVEIERPLTPTERRIKKIRENRNEELKMKMIIDVKKRTEI